MKMRLSFLLTVALSNAASAADFPSLKETNPFRTLQNVAPASTNDTCNPDGSVNFSDDFNMIVFGSKYSPVCNCTKADNSASVFQDVTNPSNPTNVKGLVDAFNAALGNLAGSLVYDCVNTCATCFDSEGFCGILETSENTTFSGSVGNFTYLDITSGFSDYSIDRFIAHTSDATESCITYTSGESGRLCVRVQIDGIASAGADLSYSASCNIEYDNTMCKSCTAQPPLTDKAKGCIKADCTNINGNATIDSCAGTGFVGPFRYLKIVNDNGANTTTTLGGCNGASVPAATTGDAPNGSPPVGSASTGSLPTGGAPAGSPFTGGALTGNLPTGGTPPHTASPPLGSTSGATGLIASEVALLVVIASYLTM